MVITFLLGNGLDLNCGCKSRYQDIYEYYLKQPSPNEWIKRLKSTISKDIPTWGDFEMEMARFISTCKSEEEAIECIRDFKRHMDFYLILENNRMTKIITTDNAFYNETMRSIERFCDYKIPNVKQIFDQRMTMMGLCQYTFISFNYTTFLDSLLISVAKDYSSRICKAMNGKVYIDPSIIHIHGSLYGDELVGIDNTAQFGTIPYKSERLERVFVKPNLNNQIDSLRVDQATKAIEKAEVVCVFGMSLGDSDLTWRNKIVAWLQTDENHHLFLYDYECSCKKSRLIDERIEIEESAKRVFMKKNGITVDKLRNQIHIPVGVNIFNIGDVVDKARIAKLERGTFSSAGSR